MTQYWCWWKAQDKMVMFILECGETDDDQKEMNHTN